MDKVNFRQLLCMTFLLALAMKMFMLPVLLMRASGRDAFLAMIIALAIDFVFLAVICVALKLSGEDSLFKVLESTFGKVISRIVVGVVSLFYVIKIIMIIVDLRIFFSTALFGPDMNAFHFLPFMLLMVYFAHKPLSVLGRLAELFTPFVIVSMLILGAITLPEVDFSGLMPFVEEGWGKIFLGVFPFGIWYGDFTALLLFSGKNTVEGKKIFFILIAAFVSMALLMSFATVIYASYGDMTEVLTYGHNISNMTQYAVGSYRFGRFDLLIFCVWLTGLILSAGIFTTFFRRGVTYALGDKLGNILAVGAFVAVFIVFSNIEDLSKFIEFSVEVFSLPSQIAQYGFVIFTLIAAIVNSYKRKKLQNYSGGEDEHADDGNSKKELKNERLVEKT